ncbi:MAG: hypothetical protein HYX73_04195 [Acidobacteria bacterium]|nr:hypothetical protein [Acidobacteriota bacterium]
MRCVHLNRVGDQCRDQALEGRQLCAFHSRILEDDDPEGQMEATSGRREGTSRFPMIYRLAALILLLLILLDTFGSIRSWLDW